MKRLYLILLVFPALLCNCKVSEQKKRTVIPPGNTAISQEVFNPIAEGYKLFWEDNFDGTELDNSKWAPRGTGPDVLVIMTLR